MTAHQQRVTARSLHATADQLTDTDLTLIRFVSDLRFMSGDQLTRLCFHDGPTPEASARAARRALARLVSLGCLDRLPRRIGGVRSGSGGFVYYLGLAGQRLSMERGWVRMRRRRRALVPGTMFLSHCLQVAELHTVLHELHRAGKLELLELAAEPACWQSYAGRRGQAATLKPDSYLRLGVGEWEELRWFEIDMGSEGSGAVTRQLKRYLAFQASGQFQAEHGVFPRVLWTVPDEARAEVIRACIDGLPEKDRAPFTAVPFADAITTLMKQHTPN